jgi:hypothetical protein
MGREAARHATTPAQPAAASVKADAITTRGLNWKCEDCPGANQSHRWGLQR